MLCLVARYYLEVLIEKDYMAVIIIYAVNKKMKCEKNEKNVDIYMVEFPFQVQPLFRK